MEGTVSWRLVAALLPVALSLALLVAMLLPKAPSDAPVATAAIGRALAQNQPQQIVVGNSAARVAIDAGRLGRLTGLSTGYATLKDSTAPTWYAMLAYTVFGQGLRPARVIVAGPEGALGAVAPGTTHDLEYLLDIAGTDDDEIVHRVGGPGPLGTARYRMWTHRATWRSAAIRAAGQGFAEVVVGTLARRRTEHLFTAVDRDPLAVLPEVDGDGEIRPVDETFLPALADLAAQYKSQLVVVRIPARRERAIEERRIEMGRLLGERGATWLGDLGAGLGPDQYQDGYHLTGPGRIAFTRELAAALR
jgi:hypothetical protein